MQTRLTIFSIRVAILLQKHPNFPFVPYFDECCEALKYSDEYPTDKYLAHLVQLQHIAEKVDQLSTKHGNDLKSPMSGTELYVMSLKSDLESFQNRLSFDISNVREY